MKCSFCENKAVYKPKEDIGVCRNCFGDITDNQFFEWHDWFKGNKKGNEPELWIYNSEKRI